MPAPTQTIPETQRESSSVTPTEEIKVAFLSASVSRGAGGLFNSVRRTAQALQEGERVEVEVLGAEDERTAEDLAAWAPLRPHTFPKRGPEAFGYAPGMAEALSRLDPDVVHAQALWMYPSVVSSRWGRETGRPTVITPRGMLCDWGLAKSRWKKRIAGFLYEDRHLREAACIHALHPGEGDDIRAYGLSTPVCVIPNGIDLPDLDASAEAPPWRAAVPEGKKVLLFLSRIAGQKGLGELIEAWARVRRRGDARAEGWDLVVAGWGDALPGFKEQTRARGVERSVHFVGPMFGDEKTATFRHADAFVLASHAEGLPMAVLEAWSFGLPVLKSAHCHIPQGFKAEAALQAEPDADAVVRVLDALFSMTDAERTAMGGRGRALVERRFTWRHVAHQMRGVYDWLLGAGPKPDCVRVD